MCWSRDLGPVMTCLLCNQAKQHGWMVDDDDDNNNETGIIMCGAGRGCSQAAVDKARFRVACMVVGGGLRGEGSVSQSVSQSVVYHME